MNFLAYELLPLVVNMSLTSGVIILVVLLGRLLLKRAPRAFSYALWAVVLFRLLCPVSVGSALSLLNVARAPVSAGTGRITMVNFAGELPRPDQIADVPPAVTHAPAAGPVVQTVGASVDWMDVLAYVWALIALAMLLWALVSYLSLRVRLWDSKQLDGRIYVSRRIETAFVAGFILPKIYIPANLTERERECVLAHERCHIRRGDHIIKPLAYIALCLHWFNPLVWLAWVLAMRDMESSCDEAALRRLGAGSRADYAQTLLNMAAGRSVSLAVSLSFGDDTKRRIKGIAKMKSHKKWASVLAAALAVVIIAGCAANPPQTETTPGVTGAVPDRPAASAAPLGEYASVEEYVHSIAEHTETVEYTSSSMKTATAEVQDTQVSYIMNFAEVDGLAPDGTLEYWTYRVLYSIDADPEDVMLTSSTEYYGSRWFSFWPSNVVYALRHSDGSYDILYDRLNGFMGGDGVYTGCYAQQLHDWYVTTYKLDRPRCFDFWRDRLINMGADIDPGVDLTVRRCDGDGWYIYAPVSEWQQTDIGARYMSWRNGYVPEAVLTVARIGEDEDIHADPKAGYELLWDTYQGDGCAWLVTATWPQDASVPEYAAPIAETMQLLFESFTVDPDFAFEFDSMAFNARTAVYHGGGWSMTVPARCDLDISDDGVTTFSYMGMGNIETLSVEYLDGGAASDRAYEDGDYSVRERYVPDGEGSWHVVARRYDYASDGDGTLDAIFESFALE